MRWTGKPAAPVKPPRTRRCHPIRISVGAGSETSQTSLAPASPAWELIVLVVNSGTKLLFFRIYIHYYQERWNGGDSESFVAAEVGVGDESSEQSSEVAGAVEDVDDIGSCDGLHVEDCSEVD